MEHRDHGDLIRKTGYASWCESDNNLEVSISNNEDFVGSMVSMLTLERNDGGAAFNAGGGQIGSFSYKE